MNSYTSTTGNQTFKSTNLFLLVRKKFPLEEKEVSSQGENSIILKRKQYLTGEKNISYQDIIHGVTYREFQIAKDSSDRDRLFSDYLLSSTPYTI